MDVARLVRTHVTSSELAPPNELVTSVNDGQTPLLEIVKALGEYLTSTEDQTRLKGLTFLTNFLRVTTPSRVNRQATRTLIAFYSSKLDDFDSLPPAIEALTVLSKLPTFDDAATVEVYKGVVENVKMKSYVQATRHLVYVLFDSLISSHRKALKDMGSEFINSYTKMVDGEKDPRNLLLLFSMARVILIEFDVEDHIEDLFDVTFCYFPITFKPPPNDPYGITSDDLKIALRACMSASPHFAKMALPLFLEKFATAAGPSMKDLMQTMAACFPTYGADAVRERGTELWEGIRTEIMYSSDAETEAAALSALESLMATLYPRLTDTPTGLAQDIIKECLDILQEPEKSQGMAVTKALAALIRGSPSAGKFALSQSLPQLFRQFNVPLLPAHRSPILSAISSLLIACRSVYTGSNTGRRHEDEKSISLYRDPLLDTLKEGLRKEGLRAPAIRGGVALIEIPGFLNGSEVDDLVKSMDDVLLNDEDPETRRVVIKGLSTISKIHPNIIESITLPLLFHNLPDIAPGIPETTPRHKYRSILKSLEQLCTQPALFETLIIRITTKLDLLSSVTIKPDDDERESNVAYAFDLLHCLSAVIAVKLKEKHVDVIKYFDQLVPRLYALVVAAAGSGSLGVEPLFRDRRLLRMISGISETLIWELNTEKQNKVFSTLYDGFEQGQMGSIVFEPSKNNVALTSSPLRAGASIPEQNLIAIYSSAIQGLKSDCTLPFQSAPFFLSSKIRWTLKTARDGFQTRFALDLITSFVNKRSRELEDSLGGILEGVWMEEIQDTTKSLEERQRGLRVYLHIVKALMLLRHPLAYTAIERIIEILPLSNLDPQFVDEAARGFGVLAEGKGKGKVKDDSSHLTAKLLYAQKMWNFILPKLIQGDKDAPGLAKLVYLVAFTSLLPLVPPSLCLSDLPTILPFLLRSLSLPSPDQRTNAITTLTSILETENLSKPIDGLLHGQAQTMVESLLKSALPSAGSGEMVSSGANRAAALRCLAAFPDAIRYEVLHPLKASFLRDLGKALDDPLRVVRREAVDCRAKWYRYGAAV